MDLFHIRVFDVSHFAIFSFQPSTRTDGIALVGCDVGLVYVILPAMMEKYRLVEEYRGEGEDFLEEESSMEEVRITHLGKPKNYISYAMSLFVSDKEEGM